VIIADTGFWLALANRKDRHHAAARQALAELSEGLVTTWPVVNETCHLLASHLGVQAELRFVKSLQAGAAKLASLSADDLPRMAELMQKYRDLPMDLADASLVLLAEQLGSGRILSTDERDFKTYRWKSRKPFNNLLVTSL
jgi:uncharacterized protein